MKPLKLAAIRPEIGYEKRIAQETYKTESIRTLGNGYPQPRIM
jgi:hypothetical protein